MVFPFGGGIIYPAMSMTVRPRGRPPKYPPDEVRRRLLDAARGSLKVEGVESGLDAVTLDGAIVDADVPRGMAYRIWQDDGLTPQDAFRKATVIDLLSIPATAGLPATEELTLKFFDEHRNTLENGNLQERRALLRESLRVVGGFNYTSLAESENWKLYSALRTAAITRPNVDPTVMEVLLEGERYLIEQYCRYYGVVQGAFRLRLRDDLTMQQFAEAAYALNEGLAQRVIDHDNDEIMLRDGDGTTKSWTLFAVALSLIHI